MPSAAAAIDREAAAELARERATMANEDARSYLAQRHFVGSLQVPRDDTPMTWQAAYQWRHQHWLCAAARAHRARDAAAVERALREQLGSDTEDEEEEEEEDLEEDQEAEEEAEEVRVISPPPAAFVLFSGNGHRLDDA